MYLSSVQGAGDIAENKLIGFYSHGLMGGIQKMSK